MTPALSIGDLSAATGLSAHTLRFYEQENLFVRPVARDGAGRRVYRAEDAQWLVLVTRLRDSGMALAVIAHYAALVREGEGTEKERLGLLREHQQRVQAEMDRLAAGLTAVTRKIDLYERALAGEGALPGGAAGDAVEGAGGGAVNHGVDVAERAWTGLDGECLVPAPPARAGRQLPPDRSRRRTG
ncbi:MerR family transcriptional regulator [Kineosporia sp. J2-2]|uniref:MerR family transcriptional regulator n=1 Tax=Kineosporia corallincola TaxID=2835133 RepID=A0ABS5TDV3_9ACTN|nr:MerR family transcriptional regulator [Kineosporia corallincola]MBT0768386.1 MerR family transcriptional regulator [Kineosporia corallincola]